MQGEWQPIETADEAIPVSETLVIGSDGLPRIREGYTEIAGVRHYYDRLTVNQRGELVLIAGRSVPVLPAPPLTDSPAGAQPDGKE